MKLSRFAALACLLSLVLARPALAQKYVCMESNQGNWCLEMLSAVAPNTVNNFLRYVESGAYTNSLIHRSVPGYVIQGGGHNIDVEGRVAAITNYGTIQNEFNRSNLRGTVAMAKLSGDLNSASNQWFINLADNSVLDSASVGAFTVFAEVAQGMDVIDRIAGFRVGNLSWLLGLEFGEVPVNISASATTVGREDLVIITRAYSTNLLPGTKLVPYHCTAAAEGTNPALTELCGNDVSFPLQILGGGKYEVTLSLIATQPQLVFAIKQGTLKPLPQPADVLATFDQTNFELVIPSVQAGATTYFNVKLKMTNLATQQFTLQGFAVP